MAKILLNMKNSKIEQSFLSQPGTNIKAKFEVSSMINQLELIRTNKKTPKSTKKNHKKNQRTGQKLKSSLFRDLIMVRGKLEVDDF